MFITAYQWLDLHAFCQASFPADQIGRIRDFTARIPANPHDPDKPVRQDTYFRALRTLPAFSIHEGHYSRKPVKMLLHPIPFPPTPPTLVRVLRSEEKESDVNLAALLLVDAADNNSEGAVIITNDSDLALAIRLVRLSMGSFWSDQRRGVVLTGSDRAVETVEQQEKGGV